jgi:hypothetical protein
VTQHRTGHADHCRRRRLLFISSSSPSPAFRRQHFVAPHASRDACAYLSRRRPCRQHSLLYSFHRSYTARLRLVSPNHKPRSRLCVLLCTLRTGRQSGRQAGRSAHALATHGSTCLNLERESTRWTRQQERVLASLQHRRCHERECAVLSCSTATQRLTVAAGVAAR